MSQSAMEAQRAERLVRCLIQAMEPSLRGHLGDRAADRDFIAELYLGLRRMLGEYEEGELRTLVVQQGVADQLALIAYLVAESRGSGDRGDPELLESLRGAIARTLTGAGQNPGTPDAGGRCGS